jgi:hypothetical protein
LLEDPRNATLPRTAAAAPAARVLILCSLSLSLQFRVSGSLGV